MMQALTKPHDTRIAVQHAEAAAGWRADQHPAVVRAKVEGGKGRSQGSLLRWPLLGGRLVPGSGFSEAAWQGAMSRRHRTIVVRA
jgi:hypothetical protein